MLPSRTRYRRRPATSPPSPCPPPVSAPGPRARVLRALVLLASVAGLGAAGLLVPGVAAASMPATGSGWNLVWSDDFSGAANTAPDTSNWLYDSGHCYPGCPANNWGTGEIESVTSSTSNVSLDGSGDLAITPIRDASGDWTSGRIETQRTDFAAPSGGVLRVEGRLRLPNVTGAAAQGYWPAFWMLGAPFRGVYTNWPSIGEIDIMENVNGVNTEYGTLHCGVGSGGPCNETSGLGGNTPCTGTTCQGGFHTYAMEYDRSTSPEQIRWYLDGLNFWTVRADQVDATTWANATSHGFFVILNVAMGGGWPGSPTSATASGAPMLVDYVAVYTSSGHATTTTTRTTTSTTTRATTTTTSSGAPVTGSTLYLRGGGALSGTAGSTAGTDTVASAGGVNSDGTPRNATTYRVCGITGTYDASRSTAFDLAVDAGTAVGNGIQARVSYDPTGSGTYTRTETFPYFAADPVTGWEHYTQGSGPASTSGSLVSLTNGCVRLELWNAIGNAPTSVRVDAPAGSGQASSVSIPFRVGGSTTTSTTSRSATTTTSAGGGARCTATVRIANQWPGGVQGDVVVTNAGASTLTGWTATLTLPAGWTPGQTWNAVATAQGSTITLSNASWNGALAPSGTTDVGFLASTPAAASGSPSVTCSAR